MKKAFLLILVLAILSSSCLAVSAAEVFVPARPLGYDNDEVDILGTVDRATMEQLCMGEDGTYSYTNLGTDLGVGLTSSESYGTLDAAAIADVADITHGISLIGATKLDRPIQAISDSVWTNGGGSASSPTKIGDEWVGAGGWTLDTYFYNASGETQNGTAPNTEAGYIYTSLLTYNFGSSKRLDYMIFAPFGSNALTGCPVAGDIYISEDGINWKLHSYYDIAEIRSEGTYGENRAYDCFSETYLGKDRYNGTSSEKYGIAYNFEGLETQYLRIAFTGGRSKTSFTTYDSIFNDVYTSSGLASGIRDILMIGGEPVAEQETEAIRFVGTQNSAIVDNKYGIRMIAEIDSLDYLSAGFKTEVRYFESANTSATATAASGIKAFTSTTAYSSLLSFDGDESKTLTPSEGKYFVAINITDIPVESHLLILEITPTATAENGEVTGQSYCVVFVDGVYRTTYSLTDTSADN